MKDLRKIIPSAIVLVGMTVPVFGQNMIEKDKLGEKELMACVTNDLDLTTYQQDQMHMLEDMYLSEVERLKNIYKVNTAVYLNKLRLLEEQHDARVRDYLTLEQYAIYLNNNRKDQKYDSKYKSEDVWMKREDDGDVYYSDDVGKIILRDDFIYIKNDLSERTMRVTENKIVFDDDTADRKVKIKKDKLVIKEEGEKEVIKTDEADFENELVEIDIDVDETVSQK